MHQCCRAAPSQDVSKMRTAHYTHVPRERDVCDLQEEFLPAFTIAVNSREMFLPHWLALDPPHLVAVGTTIFSAPCRCPSLPGMLMDPRELLT